MRRSSFLYTATFVVALYVCILVMPKENIQSFLLFLAMFSLAIFLICLSNISKNSLKKSIFFWLGMFVMGALMAFRAQTGLDDWQYRRTFLNVANQSFSQYIMSGLVEKGFLILNYFLYKITNGNYDIAQMLTTYLSFIIFGKAIKKYENNCNIVIMALLLWTHYCQAD